MESTRRRQFSIFGLVFILIGLSGINISGAVPTKYNIPAAPTDVHAVGGVERATLTWKAPYSNGGMNITAYKVTYYPGAKAHMCNSAALRCIVDIPNPDKPSSKPPSVWYMFTVAAVNSVGTGPVSMVGHARVLVKFRASIYIAPKYGTSTPTPTPTPTPSINTIPAPTPVSSPTFAPAYVTNAFDGTYTGNATVTTKSALSTTGITTTIPTSFVVYAGRGSGRASNWSVDGYITDSAGKAEVTVADSLYGSLTFVVSFTQDPITKEMNGTGKGIKTFAVPGYGNVSVEFIFSVSDKK